MTFLRRYTFAAVTSFVVAVAALAVAMGTGGGASASVAPSIYVDPPTQTVSPGATFTITLRQNSTVPTIGTQATVRFDQNLVQIDTIARGSAYTGSSLFAGVAPNVGAAAIAEANTTGVLKYLAVFFMPGTGPAPSGDQAAMVITMHALAGANGASQMTLTGLEMGDSAWNPITGIATTAGTVNVDDPACPPPTSTWTASATGTGTPTATGTATPTNTPGNLETPTDTGTATNTPTATSTACPGSATTITPTSTATPLPTYVPTMTATPTMTITPTVSNTPTMTSSPIPTVTVNPETGFLSVASARLTVPPNTDFTVYVTQSASFTTIGAQTDFSFNPHLVQLTSVQAAPAYATAALQAGVYSDGLGRAQTLAEAIAEANTTGTLKNAGAYYIPGSGLVAPGANGFLILSMKSQAATGTSDLTLSNMQMPDRSGASANVTGINGHVTIQNATPTATFTPGATATVNPETGSLAVAPATQTVPPNTDFTVFVNQSASFVTLGAQTDFSFNPSLVQVVSVQAGPAFSGAALQAGVYSDGLGRAQTLAEAIAEANTTGTLKNVAAYYLPGGGQVAPGENGFLYIHMKAQAAEGVSALTLSNEMMLDAGGFVVQTTGTNGQVTIQNGPATPVPPTNTPTSVPTATNTAAATTTAVPTATSTPGAAGTTTLTGGASAGASELFVASTAGFSIGDSIRINPGGANQEDNTIAGFASIILQTPLHHGHFAAEVIVRLSGPPACLTFGQKVDLTIGIMRRFGSHAGSRRYNAKFDVNGDGVIDGLDLLQVATTATCGHGHGGDGQHGDDGRHAPTPTPMPHRDDGGWERGRRGRGGDSD